MSGTFTFNQQLLFSSIVFFIPLNKKRFGIPVFVFMSLVMLSFDFISCRQNSLGDSLPFLFAGTIVFLLIPLMYQFLMFKICTSLSANDSFFAVVCSYATQHLANCAGNILVFILNPDQVIMNVMGDMWLSPYSAVFFVCMVSFYFIFAKRLCRDGIYGVKLKTTLIAFSCTVIIAMFISSWAKTILSGQKALFFIPFYIYDMWCCLFLLFIHLEKQKEVKLEAEIAIEKQLNRMQAEQYEISRQNIDIINMKCHDLKHQIDALRFLKDDDDFEENLDYLQESVDIYDSQIKTGNKVLDTVLNQKSLICRYKGIAWTCMAQGSLLSFMNTADTYVFFGNIMDNAIEAVIKIEEKDRRIISMTVHESINSTVVEVQNYMAGELSYASDLPATTKENNGSHGWGLKSIKSIAGKYGGFMNIKTKNGVFYLTVLFPSQ